MKADLQLIKTLANNETTVQQLWENLGKIYSCSNVYHLVRKHNLPFKRSGKTRPFKHLSALKELDTASMTVRQMMNKLGIHSRNDYKNVISTLKRNDMSFMPEKRSEWDLKLLAIDTNEMTIEQIAKEIGMIKKWQSNKLYEILPKLGKTYKSSRTTAK